jgi:hypothetical protein
MTYTWAQIPVGLNFNTDIVDFLSDGAVRSSLFRMVLIDGSCDFGINYTQLMPTWQSGDVHDCDHITFRTTDQASRTKAAVAILQPNLIASGSRLTVQNTITFIQGPEQSLSSGFGVYFGNTNSPGGTMEEHHNGFDGLALDACTGPAGNASTNHANTVCNIAAATPALDPGFNNPTGTFTWLHTAGAGLNGEGTFAALVVPDLRVTNVGEYKDAADDSTPLQQLDKGALQDYAVPLPAGSDSLPVEDVSLRYCVSVVYDPGGENETDLSTKILQARPIRLEKDVLLRQYRANDLDISFTDMGSLFVTLNPESFLVDSTGRPNWYNKRVEVVASFGTSPIVRFVGFLVGVEAERGVGSFRIANRFQALSERQVRANQLGRLVSTTGDGGIGPSQSSAQPQAPATGSYLGDLSGINAPPAQTYTVTFEDGGSFAPFTIAGSVTGFEGSGTLGTLFSWVSVTGHLSINTFVGGDFVLVGIPTTAKGNTCTFELLWRPTVDTTLIDAILEFLLDPLGCGLTVADLDMDSFNALQGGIADQVLPEIGAPTNTPRLAAVQGNCLDALQAMALHAGCVIFETSEAKIGLSSFMPRAVSSVPTLCTTGDLMSAQVSHLPIYNEFSIQYTFEERTQQYTGGRTWPPVADNDSLTRYGRRLPAPSALAFRGFDGSNAFWAESIAQALYLRYRDPRRTFPTVDKVGRLDAELNDIYRLDSVAPDALVQFVEPAEIAKMITGPLTVEIQLVEVDADLVSTECGGLLGYDDPDQGYDDECWGYF